VQLVQRVGILRWETSKTERGRHVKSKQRVVQKRGQIEKSDEQEHSRHTGRRDPFQSKPEIGV
jgi:hypothetical protein